MQKAANSVRSFNELRTLLAGAREIAKPAEGPPTTAALSLTRGPLKFHFIGPGGFKECERDAVSWIAARAPESIWPRGKVISDEVLLIRSTNKLYDLYVRPVWGRPTHLNSQDVEQRWLVDICLREFERMGLLANSGPLPKRETLKWNLFSAIVEAEQKSRGLLPINVASADAKENLGERHQAASRAATAFNVERVESALREGRLNALQVRQLIDRARELCLSTDLVSRLEIEYKHLLENRPRDSYVIDEHGVVSSFQPPMARSHNPKGVEHHAGWSFSSGSNSAIESESLAGGIRTPVPRPATATTNKTTGAPQRAVNAARALAPKFVCLSCDYRLNQNMKLRCAWCGSFGPYRLL